MTDYDFSTDVMCAMLSRIARKDRATSLEFNKAGFINVKKIKGAMYDTECFVCESRLDNAVYVVFRGTEVGKNFSVRDIITDLDTKRVRTADGYGVHRGFAFAWMEVADAVTAEVESRESACMQRLVITGHSLGGALACMAAFTLADHWPELVTFGQPRVSGVDFMYFLEENITSYRRYVYQGDAVTCIPFGFGYTDGGTLMQIQDSKITENASAYKVFKDNFTRFGRRFLDHRMQNYERSIKRAYLRGDKLW